MESMNNNNEDMEDEEEDVEESGMEDEVIEENDEDEEVVEMEDEMEEEEESEKPDFPALTPNQMNKEKKISEIRKVRVPRNRITPLRENWMRIYTPIVEQLKLQIRMNLPAACVELRTSNQTADIAYLQKAVDFVTAFTLGFSLEDSIALLRMDDLYIDSFKLQDVKMLVNEHIPRAIGRVAGKDGKTKFTIENVTRTRIVVADNNIHILGSFSNIQIARDAICDLILGSPPGKVYAKLRTIAGRMKERA